MQFYLCKKANGATELAPTQADAKAIDRNFKAVDVPTDKAGLMQFINNLYALALPAVAEVSALDAPPPAPVTMIKNDKLPADYRGHPDDCPGCLRSKRAAELLGHSDQITAIGDIVGSMTERFALKRIEEHVNERKKDLDAIDRKAAKVQPVARARVVSTPGVDTTPGPNDIVPVAAPRARVRSKA